MENFAKSQQITKLLIFRLLQYDFSAGVLLQDNSGYNENKSDDG